MEWLNLYGLLFVAIIMIPNIVFAIKCKDATNKCNNKFINIIEQIGRYACMLLMIFNIGVLEYAYISFIAYIVVNVVLTLAYVCFWIVFYKKYQRYVSIMLAVIPSLIFILSGILSAHYLLLIFGICFSFAHITITIINTKE